MFQNSRQQLQLMPARCFLLFCANGRATRYRLSPRADTPARWHGVFNGERLSAVVLVCLQRSVQKQTVQILERGIKMRGVKVAFVS